MQHNIIFNLNMKSTFWTASERSLRATNNIKLVRYTHRLSRAERQRRIDFVRAKHWNEMEAKLSGWIAIGQTAYKWTSPTNAIVYNRGKLKVNAIGLAAEFYKDCDILRDYTKLFPSFFEQNRELRLLAKLMRLYRRYFGSSCFETGKLDLTSFGYYDITSRLIFRKPFFEIQTYKRELIKELHSRKTVGIFYKSPAFLVIKERFERIREFIDMMRNKPGVHFSSHNSEIVNNGPLKHVPHFDGNMLGERPPSEKQMAGMRDRKILAWRVGMWYMLWKGPVIKRSLFLHPRLRLDLHFSLTNLSFYSPLVSVVDRSSQNKPDLIKFSTPGSVKELYHHTFPDIPIERIESLPIRIYAHHEMWSNPRAFRNLHQKRKTDKFLGRGFKVVRDGNKVSFVRGP